MDAEKQNMTNLGQAQKSAGGECKKCKCLPVIIVLAILAVGGIGFGGYELWVNAQNGETITNLEAENASLEAAQIEFNDENTSKGKYDSFVENLIKDRKSIGVTGYYYHDGGYWTVVANIDTNGHLIIEDRNDNMSADGEKVFEGDGYIGVYFVRIGNGSVPFFYLISEDGSVSRINIEETESREIEKLEGYSNIISITNSGGTQALLIDIDGNTYITE